MNNIRIITLLLALSFFSLYGYAQVYSHSIGYLPISDTMRGYVGWSIEEKTQKSEAVIEGIGISSYWDAGFFDAKGHLFSSCLIRVSKVFKGNIKDSVIEIISEGGVVPSGPNKGDQQESIWCIPGEGSQGIFFLRHNTTGIQSGKGYQSFFLIHHCSVLRYQKPSKYYPITHNNSQKIDDLDRDLYPLIMSATHTPYKVLGLNSFEMDAAQKRRK
jgi:hypothetical protein